MPDVLIQLAMIFGSGLIVVGIVFSTVVLFVTTVFMLAAPVIFGYIVVKFVTDEQDLHRSQQQVRRDQETRWESEKRARITEIQNARSRQSE